VTKQLKIVGEHTMHCIGCEMALTFLLSQAPSVHQVTASQRTQEILLVLAAQQANMAQIYQQLDWLGYAVEEV
jgi:copper chaperone CopZ